MSPGRRPLSPPRRRRLLRVARLVTLTAVAVVVAVGSASADIVRLKNGRTMKVEGCRFEGESVILELPGGGEIRSHRDLVSEILPDEVPRERARALERLALSGAAAGPQLSVATIRTMVDAVARRVGIDNRLAHAVVRVESNYRPLAISPKGAMGLMQLMPALAESYDLNDPFDPEGNLEVGLSHLRRLLIRYDVRRALAAYNAGEGAVSRYGGVPPYRETQSYVQRIIAALR
jgi:Transglycosylase SLT domain